VAESCQAFRHVASGLTSRFFLTFHFSVNIVIVIITIMQRVTKQREILMKVLRERRDHPTADSIYTEVKKILPNISLGTVYRNLEKLAEQGTIKKIELSGKQSRFDPVTLNHAHFRCIKCGIVEDLPFNAVPGPLDHEEPWVRERKILDIKVEYQGLCKKCRE